MYNVTIIGNHKVGKSSLCSQWKGYPFQESFCSTFFVEKHQIENLTIREIPGLERFHQNIEEYFVQTDVFVLVVNKDSLENEMYERMRFEYSDASWLLIMNGAMAFPKCCTWARDRDMFMVRVNLKEDFGIIESFTILQELTQHHQERSAPVHLMDGVYQWLPGGCL